MQEITVLTGKESLAEVAKPLKTQSEKPVEHRYVPVAESHAETEESIAF